MPTSFQPDVPAAGTHDVLDYQSPAAGESIKARRRRRVFEYLIVIAICAALIALLLPPLPRKRSPAITATNRSQSSQYMAALAQHFATKGTYPAKLDDLVPQYLPALPRATRGTKWSYRPLNNGAAYDLSFTEPRYVWRYNSISDKVNERVVRGQ